MNSKMTGNSAAITKLALSQLNWWGMLVAFGTGFNSVFWANLGMAQGSGMPFVVAVKTSAVAGAMSGFSGVAGVLTQRTTGADGKAPILPGLLTTDTAAMATDAVLRLDSPDALLWAAVKSGEMAWEELERRKQDAADADQAKADAAAATAAQIADLEVALNALKDKQTQIGGA